MHIHARPLRCSFGFSSTRLSAIALVTMLAIMSACGRQAPPVESVVIAPPPPPPSAWIDADSKAVADSLIGDALRQPWVSEFRDRNQQRQPTIKIGIIADRSNGAVDVTVLIAEVTRALNAAGLVAVVNGDAKSDFLLNGAIGEQDAQDNGEPVKLYQVDLVVVDAFTGDPICPVGIEKKKDDKAVTCDSAECPTGACLSHGSEKTNADGGANAKPVIPEHPNTSLNK